MSKNKKNLIRNTYNWIKNNPILFMWLLLSCSALFNIGYFAMLDIRYITFLHISDYYAATIISMCIILFLTCSIWLFFFPEKENIISRIYKIFKKMVSITINDVKLKYKIRYVQKRLQKSRLSTRSKKQKFLDKLIEEELCCIKIKQKARDKKTTNILKDFLIVLFNVIVICIMYFVLAYHLFGIAGCILLFSLFIATVCADASIKHEQIRTTIRCFIILFSMPIFGYLNLIYDIKSSDIQICTSEQCFTLLRKVEPGYFAIDKCDFLFLDNELNIRTRHNITNEHVHIICKYNI